jgi:hypothetical protein
MSRTVDCTVVNQVALSSSVRDVNTYPLPNSYSVKLPASIKSCVRLRLLSAMIPRTDPQVRDTWLDFKEGGAGGQIYSISIERGFYTIPQLASSLAALFSTDASPWSNDYSVAFDSICGRITIACTNPSPLPFSVLFNSGPHAAECLAVNLGFFALDTPFATSIVGASLPNLNGSDYVDLVIEEAPIRSCKTVLQLGGDGGSRRVLARIPLADTQVGRVKYHREKEWADNISDPVILNRLTVSLKDDRGALYDTQRFEHNFVLEMVCVGKRFALPFDELKEAAPAIADKHIAATMLVPSPAKLLVVAPISPAAKYITDAFYSIAASTLVYGAYKMFAKTGDEE